MGSGRIACVIAARDEEHGKVRVLGGASLPCKGLKGGAVVDIETAARDVEKVMGIAEGKANEVVGEVYLGVRGAHMMTFDNRGAYNLARADKEITAEDVANVIENAKAFRLTPDREILHVIPQGFSVDRLHGIQNPVGMEGLLLEVNAHIVTAANMAINNLVKSVHKAGFRVLAPVHTIMALGELLVSREEKELGCMLLDAGGETTSIAVYSGGSVHFTKEVPIGGDHISRDIAYGLGVSAAVAQEIKEKHGAVLSALIDEGAIINFTRLNTRNIKEVKARELLTYIQPRVEEIFEMIEQELERSGYSSLPGGAILTGGGAVLRGMPEAAGHLLNLDQTRLAVPAHEILECPDEYMAQTYLGAVALVCYPYLRTWNTDDLAPSGGGLLPNNIWRWFKDLF